jgi:aerobic carbon-monoxide dehydrogenase medium subunit
MKAPPFGYVRANSLEEAFRFWSQAGPEAKLLAGGQSLLAALAFRLSEPTLLLDITRVGELRGITAGAGHLSVGALTTHAELGADASVRQHAPLLAEAVPLIGHPAIRNRGTLGGSLAYADPAAELPACCVALDATIIARSAAGERRIAAREFFRGLYQTALQPNELIAAVAFPSATSGERSTILELARRSGDYAMAGIVARARFEAGRLLEPRLVFFAVGEAPVLAAGAMAALAGGRGEAADIGAAQAALDRDLEPPTDLNGGPEMKRQLARVLLARAIARLLAGAEARAA